jgi:hypothetical protein
MESSVDVQLNLGLYRRLYPIYEYLQITKDNGKINPWNFRSAQKKITVISTEPLFLIGTSMELI